MKTKGNDLVAFVSSEATTDDNLGLTKREYFAAIAMQGFISILGSSYTSTTRIAEYSIEAADALIKELNKTK